MVRDGLVTAVHDASKGGLGVALAEMCVPSVIGATVDVARFPAAPAEAAELLFSESHGRFVVSTHDRKAVEDLLVASKVPHSVVGRTGGKTLEFMRGSRKLAAVGVRQLLEAWQSPLPELMD